MSERLGFQIWSGDCSVCPFKALSRQSSAIAEPPYHLFQSGAVAGLQIQLRGSGKALAQDFGLAFESLCRASFSDCTSYQDEAIETSVSQ